jgi:lysozyme
MGWTTNVADKLTEMVSLHEGVRRFPYRCTAGKLTIGVGFNLDDVGLYPEEIDFILSNRLRLVRTRLEKDLPWFSGLDEVRQAVLIDMGYNIGVDGLLKFKRTLGSVQRGDYAAAAVQMLESKWAGQVGKRAERLSDMMETGEWYDH